MLLTPLKFHQIVGGGLLDGGQTDRQRRQKQYASPWGGSGGGEDIINGKILEKSACPLTVMPRYFGWRES